MESADQTKPDNDGRSGPVRPELDTKAAYTASLEERARAVLKDLAVDDDDKYKEEEPEKRMRTKKIIVRAGEAYVKYLRENPPPQPSKPISYKCLLSKESNETDIARQKADVEKHQRYLEQFEQCGYADIEFEIWDDEEEVV